MFYLNDLKEKGIWKVRINLENAFDEEDGEYRQSWSGMWIELREPTNEEAMRLVGGESEEIIKLVGECLANHNFEMEADKKAPNGEVMKAIKASSTVSTYVASEWAGALPLVRKTVKDSSE